MKKISLSLFILLGFINPVSANDILISDTVDVYENNKYYPSIVNAVDNLKIIKVYPDHTFRGEKLVDKKELSNAALKLIKFIESEKRVSLRNPNSLYSINSSANNIVKDKEFLNIHSELNKNYSINFIKNEKNVNPQQSITVKDFVIMANEIIDLNENIGSNPYETKSSKEDKSDSLEKLTKYKIIDKNANLNDNLNRYELAKLTTKLVDHLKSKN